MAWYDEDSWLTAAFAPNPSAIAFTLLLAIVLPLLLHQFIYRKAAPTTLPTFLLIGPSGAGKTALLTLVGPPPCLAAAQVRSQLPPPDVAYLLCAGAPE